jgi:hypothetical protein
MGSLECDQAPEDCVIELFGAIRQAGPAPNFQRYARPGEL